MAVLNGYMAPCTIVRQRGSAFIILTFLLSISLHGVQSQALKVAFTIEEEDRSGLYLGNIGAETGITVGMSDREVSFLQYDFLNPSQYFSIHGGTGALHTTSSIDREKICPGRELCQLVFDVTVSSRATDFSRWVEVTVTITDVNDNKPRFTPSEITIDIPENNAEGLTKPLPTAVDMDTHLHAVQDYILLEPKGPFDLQKDLSRHNRFRLYLVVNSPLDRESISHYKLLIIAKDGGLQPLTGTLTVNVNVKDANDFTPVFEKVNYSFRVLETAEQGSVVGKVTANDEDDGENADVTYSLIFDNLNAKARQLFEVDHFTGEITIKAPLQYDSGFTFRGIVEASDHGETQRTAEATIEISIVDVRNNAPRPDLTLIRPMPNNTVRISEKEDNRIIGKLTVTDNDPSENGRVSCYSTHPSFKVSYMSAKKFTIMLNNTLDREEQSQVDVRLVCSDHGSPPQSATATFHVLVEDVNDNAPKFDKSTFVVNISENYTIGTPIITLQAQDADDGENAKITYDLLPKTNTVFGINSNTGMLTARNNFDYEMFKSRNVFVTATDNGNPRLTTTATVIVNILDANDNAPVMLTKELSVYEEMDGLTHAGDLKGDDKDTGRNQELRFYMPATTDITAQLFKVEADGKVFAIQKLDRETRSRYTLKVVVKDMGQPPLSSTALVSIVVKDVNDHAPTFHYPKGEETVIIMWNMPLHKTIAHINATDDDLDENGTVTYSITSGNKDELFRLDPQSGFLFLNRRINANDKTDNKLFIEAEDLGRQPQSSHTFLRVTIDTTNATFAALEGNDIEETYILIAGIIAGATLFISIVILVIIFLIRQNNNRRLPPPNHKHPEWQVVKTGIQEECGKGAITEKVVGWRGSDVDIDIKSHDVDAPHSPSSQPDVTKTGSENTFKKTLQGSSQWADGKEDSLQGQSTVSIGLDPYRKQEFYTFCKVRSPHDDVNSVTSGETTTSDSGRGGSEDDIPLPPIAECSPELNSAHGSPKHITEYRPITTLPSSGLTRQPIKSDFRTMPSLSSFRSPDTTKHNFNNYSLQNETSLTNTYPYDKIHPSSRSNHGYTSLAPTSKTIGSGRHVTFSAAAITPNRHEPVANTGIHMAETYDHAGLYSSLPRSGDEEDGNTTTSGSYTIDSDNLNDSIISA